MEQIKILNRTQQKKSPEYNLCSCIYITALFLDFMIKLLHFKAHSIIKIK